MKNRALSGQFVLLANKEGCGQFYVAVQFSLRGGPRKVKVKTALQQAHDRSRALSGAAKESV